MQKQRPQNVRSTIQASRQKTALKRKSQVCKCYELKLNYGKMNAAQREQLKMMFVEGKWLYNHILQMKKEQNLQLNQINASKIFEVEHFDKDKNAVLDQIRHLPASCKQTLLARMISNEKTIRTLAKNGIQKHGELRFKSELGCIPLKNIDWKVKSNNRVWISKIKKHVLVYGLRQIPNSVDFANANLVHKPNGYYLVVTTFQDKSQIERKTQKNGKEIGLDFGVKTAITTSEGEKIEIQVGESDRIKTLQQKLARQKKRSNNSMKTIKSLRMSYQTMSNKKHDIANQFIHKMKCYSSVVVQDDDIQSWKEAKCKKKQRQVIQHSCIGMIKARLKMLDNAIIISKYIPTSKWCRKCGSIKNDLTLNDRVYECHCGHVEDRDVHAAKNMIAIVHMLQNENLVPMDSREVKLEDWRKFQEDPRRCSIFS